LVSDWTFFPLSWHSWHSWHSWRRAHCLTFGCNLKRRMPDKRTPSLFVIESHPTCGLGFLGHRKRALFLLSILSEKQTVDYIFRHGRKQPRLLFFVPGSNADANRILGRDENQCSFLSFFLFLVRIQPQTNFWSRQNGCGFLFFFVLVPNPTSNKFLVATKRMRFHLFFVLGANLNAK